MIARIEQVLRDNHEFVVAQLRLADRGGRLAERRYPHCLWIDCPQSGVMPARAIEFGPQRGGFVHRHVAVLASRADSRLPSIVRYAVQVQKVNHIIVCGYYGDRADDACRHELSENWLRVNQDSQQYFWKELAPLPDEARRNRLVELDILEQINDLRETDIVQRAWRHRGRPTLHGWVFDPLSGYLHMHTRMPNTDAMAPEAAVLHSSSH